MKTKVEWNQNGVAKNRKVLKIKIVLEYIDQPEIRRKIEQLTIFSDSQTAIGKLKTITELHSNFW